MFDELNRANPQPEQLQAAGYRVLLSLFPPGFLPAFRRFLDACPGGSAGWFAARHAAGLMTVPPVLEWLVGECRVEDVRPEDLAARAGPREDVPGNVAEWGLGAAGRAPGYQQVGVVKKCKVLDQTSCVSVCLNGCKIPTQRLFAEEMGLPVCRPRPGPGPRVAPSPPSPPAMDGILTGLGRGGALRGPRCRNSDYENPSALS